MDNCEEILIERAAPCFLCSLEIPPGPALRVRWSSKHAIALLGYFHAQTCGPVMVAALKTAEAIANEDMPNTR